MQQASNKILLSLEACMCEVLKQFGGHRYKVPHMQKDVLERLSALWVALECAASIVRDVIEKVCRMHVGLLVSIGFLLK
jgi:hypothetical protein